ncbi:response regulator [uncultured Lamprocystis sp.]|uniref:ATP-binding response regulator n=1 Tax=uncultured Lamprocystis sp. TaxID=543132 RepID=UPI0025CBBD36|nr:response regulator [uncultured Lamprocystis sp.]
MNRDSELSRLLVVDDDPLLVRLVCHQLADAGMQSCGVGSGREARARLAVERFDLILLDVQLPDENGYELCRDLKSRPDYGDLPVIFMTAHGTESEVLRGFDAGGVDYVVKPFDARVLLARVSTHATLARLSRRLHEDLDARTESLHLAHRRMREMDAALCLAEERERRCLADQLHDSTIQQLVLARILLDPVPGTVPGDASPRSERLRELLDLSLSQLRTLVFELSPPVLYQGGLFPAVQWLGSELSARWSVRFDCRQEGELPMLPDDLKVTLFQAARELMTNVCKHAQATGAEVRIRGAPGTALLTVRDDGIGIDQSRLVDQAAGREGGGFGLFSLRSRIELIGGRLIMQASPGGGTAANLWVPLSRLPDAVPLPC